MIKKNNSNNNWDIVIKSKTSLFDLKLSELYIYRDLILLFVKRDFVTFYKQTILGPIWYIIQPLVNTIVFTVIFGNLAKIPTDEVPPFIFYMAGTVSWGYFATCLSSTGNTFVSYKEIFGKVYFPRLIVPASNVLISLLQLSIQLFIFLCFLIYFKMSGSSIHPNFYLFFYPLVVLQTALLSFGCGILISALTAKYRDLTFVMSFGIQLWM